MRSGRTPEPFSLPRHAAPGRGGCERTPYFETAFESVSVKKQVGEGVEGKQVLGIESIHHLGRAVRGQASHGLSNSAQCTHGRQGLVFSSAFSHEPCRKGLAQSHLRDEFFASKLLGTPLALLLAAARAVFELLQPPLEAELKLESVVKVLKKPRATMARESFFLQRVGRDFSVERERASRTTQSRVVFPSRQEAIFSKFFGYIRNFSTKVRASDSAQTQTALRSVSSSTGAKT